MSYCTYITVHQPTGRYYFGKTSVKRHRRGYKGSGRKLLRTFQKYPPCEWECAILWEFDTADEALSDEAAIITEEVLADPLCMNLVRGGWGQGAGKWTDERRAKQMVHLGDPAFNAMRADSLRAYYQEPGVKELKRESTLRGHETCGAAARSKRTADGWATRRANSSPEEMTAKQQQRAKQGWETRRRNKEAL